MTQIRITSFTGSTPIDLYVADYYGNNRTLLGQITGATPPTIYEYPSSLFNGIPSIMLIFSATNGCEKFKILDCSLGCSFSISIEPEVCDTEIKIS